MGEIGVLAKRRRGTTGRGGTGGRGFAVGDVPELKLRMACFCRMSRFRAPRYAGSAVGRIAPDLRVHRIRRGPAPRGRAFRRRSRLACTRRQADQRATSFGGSRGWRERGLGRSGVHAVPGEGAELEASLRTMAPGETFRLDVPGWFGG
jgi:hypothetical protein